MVADAPQNDTSIKILVVRSTYSDLALHDVVKCAKGAGRTLRDIAGEFGDPVTYGDIYRILKGKTIRDPLKRLALGLPAMLPAPACSECGEVHTAPECAKGRKVRVVTPTKPDPEYRPRCGHPTTEQRARINRLTPDERLAKLLATPLPGICAPDVPPIEQRP